MPCQAIMSPSWAYVVPSRAMWSHLGPMLGPCWAMFRRNLGRQRLKKSNNIYFVIFLSFCLSFFCHFSFVCHFFVIFLSFFLSFQFCLSFFCRFFVISVLSVIFFGHFFVVFFVISVLSVIFFCHFFVVFLLISVLSVIFLPFFEGFFDLFHYF